MNKKAQITLEACLLIILFVAAGLAMYGYFKKAIQGNWRTNTDSFSDEQYDSNLTQEQVSEIKFIGSNITAKDITDDIEGETLGVFNVASDSGIKQISGWGTYHDGSGHEEE